MARIVLDDVPDDLLEDLQKGATAAVCSVETHILRLLQLELWGMWTEPEPKDTTEMLREDRAR